MSFNLINCCILFLATISTARVVIKNIHVTDWGKWGEMERCPGTQVAQGFQLKTERYQGYCNKNRCDDTALNAVSLFCGNPNDTSTVSITSAQGPFGEWGKVFNCYPGVLKGFRLRAEAIHNQGGDDTAANNVRFSCSTLSYPVDYIEGDGYSWGEWGYTETCPVNQAICGIQTQVEESQGGGDDTALNNLRMECCELPSHHKNYRLLRKLLV